MRAAPPAAMPLSKGLRVRAAAVALYSLAGAALALWLVARLSARAPQPLATATAAALLAGLVLASAALGWWVSGRLLPARPGALVWTGQQWFWWPDAPAADLPDACSPVPADDWPRDVGAAGTPVAQVAVAMAGGGWLLLRWLPAGGRWRWAWAYAHERPAAWHGFRVALHAHAGPAAT